MTFDRRLLAALAALFWLFTAGAPVHGAATLDRATCSAADKAGGDALKCDGQEQIDATNQEISHLYDIGAPVLITLSGTNDIVATTFPATTTLTDGQIYQLKPPNTTSSTVRLNISGTGLKAVTSSAGAALSSGDLQSTTIYFVRYYAALDQFRVMTNLGTGTASASNAFLTIGNTGSLSAERAITPGTGLGGTDGGANSTYTINITDAELACIIAQVSAADKISYWTGSGTCALADLSAAFRTYLTTPSLANLAAVLSDEASGWATFQATPSMANLGSFLSDDAAGWTTFAATPTSANLGSLLTDETGSGANVFANTPTLQTPILGAATATTINKVTITAPASAATLTIPDGVTLTGPAASGTAMTLGNTETVTGVKTFGSAGAVGRLKVAGTTSGSTVLDAAAVASGTITVPAATDTLVGKATTDTLTNKTFDTAGSGNSFSINGVAATANTGTGAVARAAGPTFTTPTLGVASATTLNKVTVTAPATAATITLIDGTTVTGPATTDTLVGKATTDTLTNKTLTSPAITTPTGIVKGDVGLGNVDNTSDATKNAAAVTLTNKILTTPVINGASTGTGVATGATANALTLRDANANSSANSFLAGYTTTATAAGTTTLTVASTQLQFFTGVTTQTVVLPVTSTLVLGQTFTVVNNSSGAVQVQSSGANNILSVAAGNTGVFTVILTSGTSAASWSNTYISSGSGTGTVTSVTCGTGLSGGTFTTTGTCNFDINSLTTDSTPDMAADFVPTFDASATASKKILLEKIAAGIKTLYIPAGAMVSRTTNGAASGSVETATNKRMIKSLDFDTTTQEFAQFEFMAPKSWNESTITAQFLWSHAATTVNFGVVWALECQAVSDDDAMDTAYGTAQQIADTGGTTNDIYITGATPALTVGSTPAENDEVACQVKRVPADGSDTMAIDARLMGVKFLMTTDKNTDN